MISLLHTLLELGHSTSKNLEFAHSPHVKVSYGEETITETNLLEIRRRHPRKVTLLTFSKLQESKNTGADWEWHIIGRAYTLKMRVQAKRIHKAGGIGNLKQMGKGAAKPQIDLLIEDAKANSLFPAYCFYCAEPQRSYWVKGIAEEKVEAFETGCLIADAETVKSKAPKKLNKIENDTVPWHFLCARHKFSATQGPYLQRLQEDLPIERYMEEIIPSYEGRATDIGLPTIFQLNDWRSRLDERKGISRTPEAVGEEIIPEDFERRGITRILKIDVRQPDLFAIRG
ncbi:hypothetical protein JET14_21915 (plasmid) [Martelella lutilitoris]|uniref:Uncharacterized protein n=1 Tax=Martelella lutilitoris TaxID=2583532 RepID=A0A7T7HPU6_9HYPH|nr:DUF6615 family protein [Martelella lutilitoris]QQM33112.1 hypothetical protein JET14_21915 [Martelella lutilitoris]QRX65261.1 hypothetical protein JS578_14595 [Dysgonomonadaceae bacterium zrk40]